MSTRTLGATLLLIVLVGFPAEAEACTTSRVFGTRAPLFLLVTAGSDTVLAGPGPIVYTDAAPDASPPPRPVFGQVFRLHRAGGDLPSELASAHAAGHTEVVLVPYASGCREVWRWTRSTLWTPPGTQILTDAKLRPPSQWIGGRPTFDVDPRHHTYPGAYWLPEEEGAPRMTPAQAFAFTGVLPTYEEVQRDAFAAYQPLRRWVGENPQLSRTFPAPAAIEEAQWKLQPCVPAHDPHPVAGTYRMTVIAGADTVAAFFRTDARGFPKCGEPSLSLDLPAVQPRPAERARLYVHGASTEAEIPETNREGSASPCGVAIMDVVNRPAMVGSVQRLRAEFNYLVLPRCFPQSAGVRGAVEGTYAGYAAGDRQEEPGTFTVGPDGAAAFEQTWIANGRVVLEMRGTRVTQETTTYGLTPRPR
jgi:hypothetical protein